MTGPLAKGPIEPTPLGAQVVRGARHPVVLQLPCEGCIHAPVCRIKPTLEEATATVSLPAFEAVIHYPEQLSIAVSCEHRSGPKAKASGPRNWSPEQRAAASERMKQTMAKRNAGGGRR